MKDKTETNHPHNVNDTLGSHVLPFWAGRGRRRAEFNPANIPPELYRDDGYFGLLLSADEQPWTWLTPEDIPERKFILVVSKNSIEDAAMEGFRGFEIRFKEEGDNKTSPVVRIANRFNFHARCLVPFIGSAFALGGIPVVFADVNQNCFMARYAFDDNAYLALHELASEAAHP